MPRTARSTQQNNLFHVLSEGVQGEIIFPTKDFKEIYLNCLISAFEKFDVSFLSYCIMDTHAHLLLYVDELDKMSGAMSEANKNYARKFNSIRSRSGSVFNGRYKSQAISTNGDLVGAIEFIHSDPVRCGKSKSIRDYDYSSAALLTSGEESFLDCERLEALLEILPTTAAHSTRFAESGNSKTEEFEIVFKELMKRYHIKDAGEFLRNDKIVGDIVVELKERSGLSIRKLAELLNVGRETLRKSIAKHVISA